MPPSVKLETPIEYLKGVGPIRAAVLKSELDIQTFKQLLLYFPYRYVDRSKVINILDIHSDDSYVQLKGKISNVKVTGQGRGSRAIAVLSDETGSIELIWFKGIRWILDKFKPDEEYIVFGKPAYFNGRFNIPHPETSLLKEKENLPAGKFQPLYNSTEKLKSKGLDSKGIVKLVGNLWNNVEGEIYEILPEDIIKANRLINRKEALRNIHFPAGKYELERAKFRLKFEELFFIQIRLILSKNLRKSRIIGNKFPIVGDYVNRFYHEKLPFELTGAQKKVIREIRADLGSGKQMNRLLQGDVGSGKTLVALMTILIALDNGFQTCLMAPTEILANQHFETLTRLCKGLPIVIYLLTGSTKTTDRKNLHERLANGEIHILIGTHALIEEKVIFSKLGLIIVDEQHRFGVAQRAALWKKAEAAPHVLVMTATPIPRTMAMTLYGDLDVSIIDELPPGRKPVKTVHFYDNNRLKVFGFIRKKIAEGRQIYFVYPLIHESEKLDLKDLHDGYESICREFPLPKYSVSMVHGQMKSNDKEYEMQQFSKGKTDILVSTTVIEVGVDVPNASVMVIENAERFGLSQLHQLRGRVGRGGDQSWCILMIKDKLSNEAQKRIQIMVKTSDGFMIAETDLKLRGPGDIQGLRQSGMVNLRIADIVKDEKILKLARDIAIKTLEKDKFLQLKKNKLIAAYLKEEGKNAIGWSMIS
ncbi:MAG: ATP-dependent DNA helicase RecG [Bacteroidales bacterium]|nr:ATP-dependent DNA helicase RecG [Bacteroidales bacterium]